MTTLDQLLASVDAARDEIVAFAQDLVRVPTINLGARPDTGNESVLCEHLRDKLGRDGLASEIHESAPGRGKVTVAFRRHPDPRKGLSPPGARLTAVKPSCCPLADHGLFAWRLYE